MVNVKKSPKSRNFGQNNAQKTQKSSKIAKNLQKSSNFSPKSSKTRVSANYPKTPKTPKTAKNRQNPANRFSLPQKVVLGVICVLSVLVIGFLIFALKFDAKFQVESKLSSLATEYYETYYYPNAFGEDAEASADFLSKFKEDGLAPVALRQLLLTLDNVSEADVELFDKYCDENATSVTFYPEEPYAKNSYHTEYKYSCVFK